MQTNSNSFLRIEGGSFAPFYRYNDSEKSVSVSSFLLQKFPITNEEFLSFVLSHPQWQKDNVASLFAEDNYLSHWKSATQLFEPDIQLKQPVVLVSWFAARAYCQSINARLPTHYEWEYAALASEHKKNAQDDEAFTQMLLQWYSMPTPAQLPPVNSSKGNFWGLHDMHGLVWQWVEDFNSILITEDARQSDSSDNPIFCGSSSLSAEKNENYPSFLRLGFLSSLKARYVTKNLGFRCAKSITD